MNLVQEVLLQVNIANEPNKLGLPPSELIHFLETAKDFPNILFRGLMVFPPLSDSDEESLQWFEKGQELLKQGQQACGESFCLLSMGTSQDYHLAVQKGANLLRIGETLMGERA